jgi:hypothetical protein
MSGDYGRPEVAGIAELHALAEQEGWGVFCDTSCCFETPEIEDFHVLWRSKAITGLPYRSEMTPQLLKPYLRYLTLHERVLQSDGTRFYRVRLMGDAIASLAGAATGDTYDRFLPPLGVRKWNALNDALLSHGKPVRVLVRADSFGKSHLIGEFFSGPLRAADDTANLIASVGRFGVGRRWDRVMAGVRASAEA